MHIWALVGVYDIRKVNKMIIAKIVNPIATSASPSRNDIVWWSGTFIRMEYEHYE